MNIDELIEERRIARLNKDWKRSDEIRSLLDEHLVFVFDNRWGQQIYYLTEKYFKFKHKLEKTKSMSNRQYVEYRIQEDERVEKVLQAWIYTINRSS